MDSFRRRLIALVLVLLAWPGLVVAEISHYAPPGYTGNDGILKMTSQGMCTSYLAAAQANGQTGASPYATCISTGAYGGYDYTHTLRLNPGGIYHGFYSHCNSELQVWNATTLNCDEPPPAQAACEALAADENYNGAVARTYTYASGGSASRCIGGCTFGPRAGFASKSETFGTNTWQTTMWGFSGTTCGITPATAPLSEALAGNAPPKSCKPADGGQSFCVKNDGDYCVTASTGREICWKPGETGLKRDGNIAQTNVQGPNAVAPTIPGETATDVAGQSPLTVTHASASTTNNTTINNYTTSGTAPANQGEAPAADSASGGSCSSTYICSGDTLKCAALDEARKTRCAVEHGNEGITGGATCAAGDVPVCAGASCNASAYSSVLQEHKSRCLLEGLSAKADNTNTKLGEIKTAIEGISGGSSGASELSGEVAMPGDGDAEQGEEGTAEGNGHGGETEYGAEGLDEEGMGFDRSCPALNFDFNGAHYAPDMFWVCTAGEIESYIMLLIVAVLCLRYIGGA